MTPLRQRFIEDLQLRNRSPKTIATYVYHVRELARYFKQSPEQLGDDQIHRYLLHLLHHKQISWSSYNQAVAALRFFYRVTSPSDTVVTRLPYGKRPKRLPGGTKRGVVRCRFVFSRNQVSVRLFARNQVSVRLFEQE